MVGRLVKIERLPSLKFKPQKTPMIRLIINMMFISSFFIAFDSGLSISSSDMMKNEEMVERKRKMCEMVSSSKSANW